MGCDAKDLYHNRSRGIVGGTNGGLGAALRTSTSSHPSIRRHAGPNGARDEFHLAATAQNLRKLAKLVPVHMPAPA